MCTRSRESLKKYRDEIDHTTIIVSAIHIRFLIAYPSFFFFLTLVLSLSLSILFMKLSSKVRRFFLHTSYRHIVSRRISISSIRPDILQFWLTSILIKLFTNYLKQYKCCRFIFRILHVKSSWELLIHIYYHPPIWLVEPKIILYTSERPFDRLRNVDNFTEIIFDTIFDF